MSGQRGRGDVSDGKSELVKRGKRRLTGSWWASGWLNGPKLERSVSLAAQLLDPRRVNRGRAASVWEEQDASTRSLSGCEA
eukprot:scaffold211702_cov27-Tisochrysis_lutea.AAC.1